MRYRYISQELYLRKDPSHEAGEHPDRLERIEQQQKLPNASDATLSEIDRLCTISCHRLLHFVAPLASSSPTLFPALLKEIFQVDKPDGDATQEETGSNEKCNLHLKDE